MASRRRSAFKVAVLIETSTAYGRGLLRGISRFAHSQTHWSLYLKPSGKDGALKNLRDWNVDGVLVHVQNLLVHTDWTMKRIAMESGFRHVENLYNVFRRETGQTPGEFRNKPSLPSRQTR